MKFLPLVLLASCLLSHSAYAAEFLVDPVAGSPDGDGSIGAPWKSLQQVVDRGLIASQRWESLPPQPDTALVARNPEAPIQPGDTIWLKSGDHGALSIRGYYNQSPITIAAAEGAQPVFTSIAITSGSNWHLKGLTVRPKLGAENKPRHLIGLRSHGHHGLIRDIVVEDCDLSSTDDVSGWSREDWNTLPSSGIQVDGTKVIVRNNRVRNVNFGISVAASHALVEHNLVENFAGDGLRGLGDHSVFQYNTVKNCYDVNDNHDDGFQSWSTGPEGPGSGKVVGLVLRGNTIINFEDPDQPFRGSLQGIGCFDGMFEDWVIENNVVIVDTWHGITLLGATNCSIVNNTVIDQAAGRPGPTWIQIGDHKKGTSSQGNLVRNNLVASIRVADRATNQIDHNLVTKDPAAEVVDLEKFDLRPVASSEAVDAGSADHAPTLDRDQNPRPQGGGVDIGAYELPVSGADEK